MNLTDRLHPEILLIALAMLVVGSPVNAAMVSVDADAHPPGTDISTIFSVVKLQAYYDNGATIGEVYSRQAQDPVLASTGANVFGHAMAGTDAYGRPRNETWVFPNTLLVMEFYYPADRVSFDIIGDNIGGGGDRAAVDVYDSDFSLIEWTETPLLGYADFVSVTIDRGVFDISFVVTSGTDGAVYIDNLQCSVIPEPATLLLLGLGAIALSRADRLTVR